MMIIYAHPNKEGHCGTILKEFEKTFNEQKINYELIDLYKIKFEPNLLPNELYSSNKRNVTKENKKIQKKIKFETKFIFIYPTWWNNMPAILKGFIDRIFVSGFAFEYKNGIPKPLLKGNSIIFTTTGSPKLIYSLFGKKRSLKILADDTLKFCGINSKKYYITNAKKLTEKNIQKIKKEVKKSIKYLI